MALLSSFTYPGKDRLAPKLRRFVGGMLIAGLLVATFFLIKPLLDPKTFDVLLSLTPLSKDKFANLLASPWAALLVLAGLSWLLSKWVAVDILEFHLFPWFDEETLRPVGEKTGLLRWNDFEDSPAHEASTKLRAWLSEGIHDGDWPISWVLRGRPALMEKAFSYALLLGPNGVGKSQLVREAARKKLGTWFDAGMDVPRQSVFARARHTLARWFRRVLPSMARLPDDPWHAGEIVPLSDWSERLKAWRPSAPTILLVDDPYGALARDVIDILDKNSGQFWYSVKLIIVDQFTPSKLDLELIGRSRRDHLGRRIQILSIPKLHWSGEQVKRAFSPGVWIRDDATGQMRFDLARDISEFWRVAQLERLSRVLDGNPLMLAEAAVWLATRNARGRPYRTIEELLRLPNPESFEQQIFDGRISFEYRSEIAHRILKERVDEVFASHLAWARQIELDQTAVIEALCCASLVGGAPLSAFEVFDKVQGPLLEKWIVRDIDKTALLPPVGSWPISEAFIERALLDFRTLKFEALARRALAVSPVGLAHQLSRKGRLANRLFDEMARLEGNTGAAAPFALNLFEVAATRAIWVDREAAPRALAALEKLPTAELAQAQAGLVSIGARNSSVPDVLVAALLLTALGARRFVEAGSWDWPSWEAFLPLWTRWLDRLGRDLSFAPPILLDPMKGAAGKLYQAFFVAAGKLNDPFVAFKLLTETLREARNATLLAALPFEDGPPLVSWPAVFRPLFALKAISLNDRGIDEGARRRAAAMAAAAKDHLPVEADRRQRAFVEAFALARLVMVGIDGGGTLNDLQAIGVQIHALSKDFPRDPYFAQLRIFEMSCILRKLMETKGDANLAWALAEEAEAICKPFLSDEACLENLIWCCGYALGIANVEDDEVFDAVVARLRTWAGAFPNSAMLSRALARLLDLRMEAVVALGERETTEARLLALASQIDAVAQDAPDVGDTQWSRAGAWLKLAGLWSFDQKSGLKIGAIARNIDAAAQPFSDHILQIQRLAIWERNAYYESRYGVTPDKAEFIARYVTSAAEQFRSLEAASPLITSAWEAAVFGWHRDTREWASCERALRRLEDCLTENHPGASVAYDQVRAWASLLVVHNKRRDFEAFVRFEPEALDRSEAAIETYPDEQNIAEYVGFIFALVAQNRLVRGADREAAQEIASRMRALAARFPHSENVRENAALVDRLLLGPAANTSPAAPAFRMDPPIGSRR